MPEKKVNPNFTSVPNLFIVSYQDKEVNAEILRLTGKAFNFITSIRMGGAGSPRMLIREAIPVIMDILGRDKYMNYCNIELRERGCLLRFRSRQETFAWAISYETLALQEAEGEYRISADEVFMKLLPFKNKKPVRNFMKVLEQKIKRGSAV